MIKFWGFMKLLHIVGARPQFIKAAMVSWAWKGCGEEYLIHTGQHYDENMSRLFFTDLKLKEPDVNLGIGSGSHAEQTASMLIGIYRILTEQQPDCVIIYGDTNSTLAGALAAAKEDFPLAHVEAGLRSYNRAMPEELNRIVSDHVSDLLFCPTVQAVENLSREGIQYGVHQVGDVMADSLSFFMNAAKERSRILEQHDLSMRKYALLTIHRSGNVDDRTKLTTIMKGICGIEFPVVFPVHPRTIKMVMQFGLDIPDNVRVIDPVGYLDMITLERNAECILTDSGGIQKEAYLLGVRCITLREETEWVETVESGWNCLVGSDSVMIRERFYDFHPQDKRPEIYGDGHASDKIIDILKSS